MKLLEYINLVKEYSSVGTLLLGICAFIVACVQINFARKNISLNSCKNEIDIFMKLDERINILFECMSDFNNAKEDADRAILEKRTEQAMNWYFNTLDTVCLYVLKNDINKQNFYRQYGEMILQLSKQKFCKKYFSKNDKGYYENIHRIVDELGRR